MLADSMKPVCSFRGAKSKTDPTPLVPTEATGAEIGDTDDNIDVDLAAPTSSSR